MDLKTILYIAAAVILLFLIVNISVYFSVPNRKGRAAEKKTSRLLKKLAKKNGDKVLNNIYLPLYKRTCEIDHLVIGKFGVFVVETKGISGTLSGSGKKLSHQVGGRTYKLYNPAMQNQTHINNVEYHLKKGGFSKVPVSGAVVFTDEKLILNADVGIRLSELEKQYLSLQPSGVNPDIIYEYFKKLEVRNPIKRYFHKFNLKDKD